MRAQRFKFKVRRPRYPKRGCHWGAAKERGGGYSLGCWETIHTLYGARMKLRQSGATRGQVKAATRDWQH